MTEEKKKNRGWVKNAIIIFLLIMLVLTFFSNTIMNHSLPEVAVQTAMGGTINAQIRGTGTVTAMESYEVSIDETRTVKSVAITAGQEVSPGDLLFTFSDSESTELESAREQLESMKIEYQRALISASDFDYARENRNIQKLRNQLADATADMDALFVSDEAYSTVKDEVTTANNRLVSMQALEATAQTAYDKAQRDLQSAMSGGGGDYSSVAAAQSALDAAKADLTDAQTALETAWLMYGEKYDALVVEAKKWIADDYDKEHAQDENPVLFADLSATEQGTIYTAKLPIYIPARAEMCKADEANHSGHYEAYTEITAANKRVSTASAAVDSAQSSYNAAYSNYIDAVSSDSLYNKYKKAVDEAQEKLDSAQQNTESAQKQYDAAVKSLEELDAQKASYKTASDNVKSIEESIEDALFELAQQQKTDEETQQLEALNLQSQRNEIAKQEALIAKLEGNGTSGNEILSQVYGIVKTVSITAGNTTSPGMALAIIEVPDMGYKTEITVTLEQSRKVTVGDEATISNNYWWGSQDISATLVSIRTDPQAPQQNRILVFSVTGEDAESGSQLTLSLGTKNQSYETVVPNSAIRQDANGSFVYIVVAKSSPVGNRYVAQRVDVQVVASDDNNSAVTGGIASGDYVITTSTAPIETGMYVKMPEG
ncbi:MAG: HlyD family efflux transporter periplasmic adaptor subunit [Oscillospiraceae bacterium]